MSFFSDLSVLFHLAVKPIRGKDHAARMESFYGGQAQAYDDFRKRLLKGREELWELLEIPTGGVWVDLGGGTGANLENMASQIGQLKKVYVVDLSSSLLEVAGKRFQERGWQNAEPVRADATAWKPPEGAADVVTFSYSLTMIPDWFAAVENALAMLKPGGTIGVVDFYVSRKYPADGLARHGWLARSLYPLWFAADNVFPSSDHVPYLYRHFERVEFREYRSRPPYFPIIRMPYYLFVGRKPG